MKVGLIGLLVLFAIGIVVSLPPIPQDVAYHSFAGDETRWGIANAANVLSNIGFIIVGFIGLIKIRHLPNKEITLMWRFFFIATIFVGLGSAYYHLLPSNDTLVWDRLPMALCFGALTACVCTERLNARIGRLLFMPLVMSGVLSVIYWWISEQHGLGDLRPYILVQYIPMIIIPLLILLCPKSTEQNRAYWLLLASYILAKGFEFSDVQIFDLTNHVISGHTLKHLAAAIGILALPPSAIEVNEGGDTSTRYCLTKKDNL
ncbi:ceramidase domain-containing protein [Dendrosporobacter sp. 1207_IL3150]|uniref:ceramidase domain-containing protein n=1 Tax=Dendrosporobacter sp. 1207_IL3150 TaxID=3084054 RepID=UPI002FD9E13A